MNRPLSRLATRAAYGASQLPRIAWYLGHGLAMTRIAQRARESGSAAPIPTRELRTANDSSRTWALFGGKTSPMSKRASIPCPRIMTAH
jgi:hypothetical protein